MNKKILKISIVAIIVGAMLLYMSFMGAAGFGLSLTGSNFKEDFNVYPGTNSWQTGSGTGFVWGTPVINPAGQLQMDAPIYSSASGGGRCSTVANGWTPPSQYTVEFRLMVDQFGAGNWLYNGVPIAWRVGMSVYGADYYIPLSFNATTITCGSQYLTNAVGNGWHVWTLVCDHTGSTFDLYMDSSAHPLVTWQYQNLAGLSGKLSLDLAGGQTSDTIAHFDYLYVDPGLIPPGGSGTTYSLTINAKDSYGANLPGMSVSVAGSSQTVPHTFGPYSSNTATATIDSSYVSGGITYTFNHWDNGATSNTRSGTLSAGSNTWTATYSSSTPPPNVYTVIVLTKDSNGAEFSGVQVTFNGQIGTSGSAIFDNVAAGTYQVQVQGSYNGMTFSHWEDSTGDTANPRSYYVSQTVTLTAYFTGSGGGGGGWDPLAGLRNLLNSFTVRTYELYGGAVVVLLGSILLPVAMFAKKKTLTYATA